MKTFLLAILGSTFIFFFIKNLLSGKKLEEEETSEHIKY